MAVTDLQTWADNLQLVRLPHIESTLVELDQDVSGFQGQLNAKSQEFTDRLDSHDAQITATQATADYAEETATTVSTQIYNVGLNGRNYTDQAIQGLRDHIDAKFAEINAFLRNDQQTYIDNQVATNLPALEGTVNQNTLNMEAIRDQLLAEFGEIEGINDQILNTELANILNVQNGLQSTLNGLQTQVQTQFTDYPFANVMDGLYNTQSVIAGQIAPLGHRTPKLPQSNWTTESTSGTFSPKVPPDPSWFHDDDVVLGDCIELPLGTDETIGQSYPVEFTPGKVFKVTARLKVVDNGTLSGVKLSLGATTWNEGVPVDLNIERDLNDVGAYAQVSDGELIYVTYFSGDLAGMGNAGYSVGNTPTDNAIHLPGSPAKKAFFHLRQNKGLATDGQIRVGMLEVSEVTDIAAESSLRQDAIAGVNGKLAAGLLMRVDAGDAEGSLELVAADDPIEGPRSEARIKADNILFDGSVLAKHITVEKLDAISATIGHFKSAETGERIEIEDDRISVFDANNTLRVRIGRLF